jgi:hypothetical protein
MAAHLTHEGEPRFVVYHCDFNDDPCQRVADYENVADVLTRKPHFDQHLKGGWAATISSGRTSWSGRGCRRGQYEAAPGFDLCCYLPADGQRERETWNALGTLCTEGFLPLQSQ